MGEVVKLRPAKSTLDHDAPASVVDLATAQYLLDEHADCGSECTTRMRAAVVIRTSAP